MHPGDQKAHNGVFRIFQQFGRQFARHETSKQNIRALMQQVVLGKYSLC